MLLIACNFNNISLGQPKGIELTIFQRENDQAVSARKFGDEGEDSRFRIVDADIEASGPPLGVRKYNQTTLRHSDAPVLALAI